MITDQHGNTVDEAVALYRVVVALDLRFPDHNTPGDRLGRLLAEIGELTDTVLTIERGTDFVSTRAVSEAVHDVLRAAGGIAHHYRLQLRLLDSPGHRQSGNPFVLLALLTHAGGAVAQTVHRGEDVAPVSDDLARVVDLVIIRALVLAGHYGLRHDLRAVIETCYRAYQHDGFLLGGDSHA